MSKYRVKRNDVYDFCIGIKYFLALKFYEKDFINGCFEMI